jgi:hypothetical protein
MTVSFSQAENRKKEREKASSIFLFISKNLYNINDFEDNRCLTTSAH